VPYQPGQTQPDLEAMVRALTESMNKLSQDMNENFAQLRDRVQVLEEPRHRNWTPDPDFNVPQPHPHQEPRRPLYRDPEPNHRRPDPEPEDRDDRFIRNIKLDAPTFDGSLNPKVYSDWEGEMDQYFEWYAMSEERKFKFAKMKLIRQARLYWGNIELTTRRRNVEPITTWQGMKEKLRDKYLPISYQPNLLDQWQTLKQGNQSVSDYITIFDEYLMRCDVSEAHEVTLSRFRAGLREDIKRELFLREVTDLDQAYQIALNTEKFQRGPMPSRVSAPIPRNGPSQVTHSKPNQGIPTPRPMDKGKAPDTQRTPSIICFKCQKPGHISNQCTAIACFKCHKVGHVSSQCPRRSLYIEEGEEENSGPNEEFEEEFMRPE